MYILGHYSNGAMQTSPYTNSTWEHFKAFSDCTTCQGQGYTERTSVWQTCSRDQCPECELRFGGKETLKRQIAGVVEVVKRIVNQAKREGAPVNVEEFNVTHPLAREYRRLLKLWWTYQPPEFVPCHPAWASPALSPASLSPVPA